MVKVSLPSNKVKKLKLDSYEPLVITQEGLDTFLEKAKVGKRTKERLHQRLSYVLETVEKNRPGFFAGILNRPQDKELYKGCERELTFAFDALRKKKKLLNEFLKYAVKNVVFSASRRKMLKVAGFSLFAILATYAVGSQLILLFKKGEEPEEELNLVKYTKGLIPKLAPSSACSTPPKKHYPEDILIENLGDLAKTGGHPGKYANDSSPTDWPKVKNREDDTKILKDYVDKHPESIEMGTIHIDDEFKLAPEVIYKNIIVHELSHYLLDYHCRKEGVYPPYATVPGTFCNEYLPRVCAEFHADATTRLYCGFIIFSDPGIDPPAEEYERADALIKEIVGKYDTKGLQEILGWLTGYSKKAVETGNPRALLEKFRYDIDGSDNKQSYKNLRNYIYDEVVPQLGLKEGSYDNSIFLSEIDPELAGRLKVDKNGTRRDFLNPTSMITTLAAGGAIAALLLYAVKKVGEEQMDRREFLGATKNLLYAGSIIIGAGFLSKFKRVGTEE